jgi:hypothetical protein
LLLAIAKLRTRQQHHQPYPRRSIFPRPHAVHGHNPATMRSKSRLNRDGECARDDSSNRMGAMNEKKTDWMAREREEIAVRVARFRATQKQFQKEREEYYAATLSSAWDGFNKPIIWT